VVGDGVVPTGFSRVVHSILERLSHKYDFHHLALGFIGQEQDLPWTIYPAGDGEDYFGVTQARALVSKIRPKIIFLVNDIWVISNYLAALQDHRHGARIIGYSPVDAGPLEPDLIAGIKDLDVFVLYTQFALREVEKAVDLLRNGQPGFEFAEIRVIPHGIDPKVFYPYANRKLGQPISAGRRLARERLFKESDFADAFIVLNANRNQPRKRIDITIKGFSLFARNKPPSVKLYLHMGVEDCGWNIVLMAKRHGIEDRLILTADMPDLPVVSNDVLNCIYNACDVGINTSIGEGWGLVSFEHAATGAGQIVPRHSACEELWRDSALMLEPCMTLTTERSLTEVHFVTPEEVASSLNQLYEDPALLADISARSFATSTRLEYNWSTLARHWDRLFREVLAKR
jgi:D-inositol-3-phosphate glycosyltransferase